PRAAGADRDAARRVGGDLHQPDRPGRRRRGGAELRLLVDDRSEKRRIQVVLAGVDTDVLRVAKRIPEPLVPRGLRLQRVDDEPADEKCEQEQGPEPTPHDTRSCMTEATNSSSSSSVPVFA